MLQNENTKAQQNDDKYYLHLQFLLRKQFNLLGKGYEEASRESVQDGEGWGLKTINLPDHSTWLIIYIASTRVLIAEAVMKWEEGKNGHVGAKLPEKFRTAPFRK